MNAPRSSDRFFAKGDRLNVQTYAEWVASFNQGRLDLAFAKVDQMIANGELLKVGEPA